MSSYRIRYSDELYHHGTKGQKWGLRRYQNEDGTYTEEGKERRRTVYNGGYKIIEGEGKSSNPWLGRKINASLDTRAQRGQVMREDGKTKSGAVIRGIGREIAASILASNAMTYMTVSSLATGNPLIGAGTALAAPILSAYSISNAIRTYQDIADISTAEGKYGNKKDVYSKPKEIYISRDDIRDLLGYQNVSDDEMDKMVERGEIYVDFDEKTGEIRAFDLIDRSK